MSTLVSRHGLNSIMARYVIIYSQNTFYMCKVSSTQVVLSRQRLWLQCNALHIEKLIMMITMRRSWWLYTCSVPIKYTWHERRDSYGITRGSHSQLWETEPWSDSFFFFFFFLQCNATYTKSYTLRFNIPDHGEGGKEKTGHEILTNPKSFFLKKRIIVIDIIS